MSRQRNSAQRRDQIADALFRVLAKHGYDGASIDEIAKVAGLAPGVVHYHFKSKLEILLHVLAGLDARHRERLAQATASAQGDAARELDAFIELHVGRGATADRDALAAWIALGGEALRQREVQAAYERTIAASEEALAAIIRRGVDGGVFARVRVAATAAAVVAAIQGYFTLAATAPSLVPRGSAAPSLKRMAAGLLGVAP
jgi:TetR/AcrR family transcriptional repressor of bet genes